MLRVGKVSLDVMISRDHCYLMIGFDQRRKKKLEKDIVGLEKRLANKGFVDKAPPEVVAEAREQLEGLKRQKARLEEARELAKEL